MTIKEVKSSKKLTEQAFGWFLGGYLLFLASLLLGGVKGEGDEE